MENYLYIIIGIVWVIYSIYNTRQKALRKQQSQGLPPQGPSESSPMPGTGGKSLLDDILRELTGEDPAPKASQPAKTYEQYQGVEVQHTIEPQKSSVAASNFTEIRSVFPLSESKNEPKTHQLTEKRTKIIGLSRKFNLREAVIFSELLNRKYF
jgi:hypothetical protein